MNVIGTVELSKKELLVRFAILAVIVAGIIFYEKNYALSPAEQNIEIARPEAFHGKVDSVYRDKSDHNVMKAILSDGYLYYVDGLWETKIDLGDSLSKEKGDLQIEVYKKNGQKMILDYNQLVKNYNKYTSVSPDL